MNRKLLMAASLLLLGGVQGAPQGTLSGQGRTFVDFQPIATTVVSAGHKAPVIFTFRIQTGYHINSNQPTAPELIPTQLHFSLPGDVVIGKLQYPAGQLKSFPFDPTQKLSVYSGDFTIRAVVVAEPQASPGPLTVHGELKYQACDNNACYPPKKLPITFNVRISPATSGKRVRHNAQSPHIH
ncbi:MAG TPA: protein-disulfide reductase DsbD N-terminal domain-containing protein [Alphaproteobacteria bacterium]|nr:protein-disulfide reductase DsbD N-terminal domain-containing protein [Alphaproteobacteria bacterium]